MARGTVDSFNEQKGYGFIESDDADEPVFVHVADVGGPALREGQEVAFDVERAAGGPRATNLTRL
ncbi:cold-shock protein [Halobacterium jilantaiense]|uniref:Cold shock protein (Beta-ribbon, CspA family) n=1 Tax=Halobacterium jilantaiense TaxID=355548 RepID=A0A1I0NN20_9EURY|nr:cold shock domain-containing protein [Halobacterium jilantaiense]SEW02728.1 cold shock protein (beta-ribbon, CspA family) [Halobacterium jilantaiense]